MVENNNFSFLRKKIPTDPAADSEHLTRKGKTKHHKMNKLQQEMRFEQLRNDRANEVIDTTLPKVEPVEKKEVEDWTDH